MNDKERKDRPKKLKTGKVSSKGGQEVRHESKKSQLPKYGLAEDLLDDTSDGGEQETRTEDAQSSDPPMGLGEDVLRASEPTGSGPASGKHDHRRNIEPEPERAGDYDHQLLTSSEGEDEDGASARELSMKLIVLSLGNEEYALPIYQTVEIVRFPGVTRVPNARKHILGVINLRGRIVPVVDLNERLFSKRTETTKNSRIVIIEHDNKTLGLLTDGASQLVNISPGSIEPPPENQDGSERSCVIGVARTDLDGVVFLLDLEKALDEDVVEPATDRKAGADSTKNAGEAEGGPHYR